MKMVNLVFFVRSAESHVCPVCEKNLRVIGSRKRSGRKPTGQKVFYVIRRLRCVGCARIHHELPDLLVPYKRYEAESVESSLTEGQSSDVAADESTLHRWRVWYAEFLPYWLGCLQAIAVRFGLLVEESSIPSPFALQQIGRYVGCHRGWLARLVRPIVNAHFWIHTRSAFLSADT